MIAMTAHDPTPYVDGFDPIDLDALRDRAELMTRHDRKYVVARDRLDDLLELLPTSCRVLEVDGNRRFRYDTAYLDTPDLRSYHDAAWGRPIRWKVRNRMYRDDRTAWTEVKLRDRRGRTVKHRHPRAVTDPWTHLTGDHDFAATFTDDRHLTTTTVDQLLPVLITSYGRTTLLEPELDGRITIDTGLRCIHRSGKGIELPDAVIVETKSPGRPLQADRLLWQLGHRPLRLSKYGTAMAAMHPDLPANRWRRTLRATPFRPIDPTTDTIEEIVR
ncbi:MAG: polyphosphate polymerase domain-containing protein [Actinobacteria bacterium]|nr:polyphosphate polymerase domain-containing protein [Actinomycetota bacterium]